MRALIVTALGLGLAACNPGVDVVARASDAGPAAKTEDASQQPSANVETCAPATSTLAVLTKAGEIHRFDLVTKELVDGGPVTCIAGGATTLAVDHSGNVWSTPGDMLTVIDPTSLACKMVGVSLNASAIAFVWDAKLGREALYAIIDSVLWVLDPTTFFRAAIGKVTVADVRGLSGTSDGRLLAFAGDSRVTVTQLPLDGTTSGPSWSVDSPDPLALRFAGGVPTSDGFQLVFGAAVYSYDPAKGTLAIHSPIFASDPAILAVAASPCITVAK